MTLEDLLAREGIRRTMAAYNVLGDANDADGFAGVFTEDGILESGTFKFAGREAIRQSKLDRIKAAHAQFVRHNITTCHIELTGPDTARAKTYFFVLTEVGPDHAGYYSDSWRKVGDGWLIAHRKVRLDWRSPQSRFGPPSEA